MKKRIPRRRARADLDRNLAIAYLGALELDEIRLKRVIDEHIQRVLTAADNNLSLAASLLGMHRRSLQRYLRRKRPARPKRR